MFGLLVGTAFAGSMVLWQPVTVTAPPDWNPAPLRVVAAVAERPGMQVVVHLEEDGTTFRLWADGQTPHGDPADIALAEGQGDVSEFSVGCGAPVVVTMDEWGRTFWRLTLGPTVSLAIGTDRDDVDGDHLLDGDELATTCSDPLDSDTDHDGLGDYDEWGQGCSPVSSDTDGDGVDDFTEVMLDGGGCADWPDGRLSGPPLDVDGDGIPNLEELELGTEVLSADVDGDGVLDPDELGFGTNPWNPDTDGGGAPDGEVWWGADPLDATDDARMAPGEWDGVPFPCEIPGSTWEDAAATPEGKRARAKQAAACDAEHAQFAGDTDGDGLNDYIETFDLHTDPLSADTDVDGIGDFDETVRAHPNRH
jgi:hypothetical protein